ncbi:abortive infection family protein [Paraburkholderia sp. 40]|uniref:abortive infection family protein n=1 Tax=Paraburkholderia sp. 40 TaxID=2991059 RepID=UPI003D1984E0
MNFDLSEAVAKVEETDIETITEITRRRIISLFHNRRICTEIEEIDFLRRLWPIDKMPTVYDRGWASRSFEDEIRQHTMANDDWANKELLEFAGALTCSQAQFFRFLALVTDPLVQTADNQAELVKKIDEHLAHDGYKLTQVRVRSGCPYYEVRPSPKGAPGDQNTSYVLEAFEPNEIHGRWHAIMESRSTDPGRTITLARTLLEDVCKWIIVEAGDAYDEKADLPVLYKQLAKILKLAPDDYTEEVFKQILGSCQSIVSGLSSIRNKLGDAHSIGPRRARPAARHAELAANLSGAMATFLVSTWETRKNETKAA